MPAATDQHGHASETADTVDTGEAERMHASTGDPRIPADIRKLAHLLDERFRLPIIGRRVGLDGLIGLIPGIGDTLSALLGLYILVRARQLGAGPGLLTRMAANLGIDWLLGSIPLLGDLFDFAFKSHVRNVALLQGHLQRAHPGRVHTVQPLGS